MSVLRPKDLQDRLSISASTLRLWTDKFGPVLSPAAQKAQTEEGSPAQRRFTPEDLEVLTKAKGLLSSGKRYDEVLEILQDDEQAEVDAKVLRFPNPEQAASPADAQAPAIVVETHPIIKAFEETIKAKNQTIETLQHELLTVQSTKDELIASLQAQIEDLRGREPAPPPPVPVLQPTRFRWDWLNRLLLAPGDNRAPGDRDGNAP